jgi:hypothetical protein
MPRHYSKVLIELPDSPSDPDVAIISIECDVCGTKRLQIHPQHLGTVARVIQKTIASFDDGSSEPMMVDPFLPSTEENKQKVKRYLDERFPAWRAERQKAHK